MPFNEITGRWEIASDLWGGAGDVSEAGFLGQAAEDYWAARTIDEDYARARADLQMEDPRFGRGFESMAPRLAGRYMLAQPFMGGGGDAGTSFAQFLSDLGSVPSYAADPADLRERAQLAADVAMRREAAQGATYGATSPARLAYGGFFGGGGSEARANQMLVAQMLARQRPGGAGGVYRGQLGKAMGLGLERLAQRRMARGADPNSFLDWYLSQTAPVGPAAAQAAAAAVDPGEFPELGTGIFNQP